MLALQDAEFQARHTGFVTDTVHAAFVKDLDRLARAGLVFDQAIRAGKGGDPVALLGLLDRLLVTYGRQIPGLIPAGDAVRSDVYTTLFSEQRQVITGISPVLAHDTYLLQGGH